MSTDVTLDLKDWNIRTNTIAGAVQDVRKLVENGTTTPIADASSFLESVFCLKDVQFATNIEARVVTQAMVIATIEQHCVIGDAVALLQQARDKCVAHMTNPTMQWAFKQDAIKAEEEDAPMEFAGVIANVSIKADGTLKKGGKSKVAEALYQEKVLDAAKNGGIPLTNQEFVQLLVDKVDMTKSGATTYAYAVRKKLGDPEGGIVKSKKGRSTEVVAS